MPTLDVRKEIRKLARELLKRHPLRRGPYIFDEDELRRIARRSEKPKQK